MPQCVICAEVPTKSLCCPAKLKRHLSTQHGNLSAKNEDYFKSFNYFKEAELKKRRLDNQSPFQKGILETVEGLTWSVAIGEKLIKPCIDDIASLLLPENEAAKLKQISLSNDDLHLKIRTTIFQSHDNWHF